MTIENINVRFFVIDFEGEDLETIEVNEEDFEAAPGQIDYQRHTVFQNGCRQICLTKSGNF